VTVPPFRARADARRLLALTLVVGGGCAVLAVALFEALLRTHAHSAVAVEGQPRAADKSGSRPPL
jgi:hypothetical protein